MPDGVAPSLLLAPCIMDKVVIRFADGTVRKGLIDGIPTEKPFFLLREMEAEDQPNGFVDVELKNVAAIFFVRDLAFGRVRRYTVRDAPQPPATPDPVGATLVRVTFSWGEVMDGLVYDFDPGATAFTLHPLGPLNRGYNTERVYVAFDAVARVEVLAAPRSVRDRIDATLNS